MTGGSRREIEQSDVSSPGLALAGYVERFPARPRCRCFGETEITYLASLDADAPAQALERSSPSRFRASFITKGQDVPTETRRGVAAARRRRSCARAQDRTSSTRALKPWLEEEFAPTTNLHGSLADVFGVGLLFVGQSGIGKSECVLDLVERGHRLVADDLVIATRRGNDVLIGRGHELQRHHMEIRGVGLVDIPAIFGIRAVRQQKRIEVVVQLEEWDKADADRAHGARRRRRRLLDVPTSEGPRSAQSGQEHHGHRRSHRDEPSAAVQRRQSRRAFNERLIGQMRTAANVRQYLGGRR